MQQQPPTGIVVWAWFIPLGFFLFFCTPTIVIDGQTYERGWWRNHFFPLTPGRHTVKIFFKYLYMDERGANSIDVDLESGQVRKIKYFMPPWVYAKGSIAVV